MTSKDIYCDWFSCHKSCCYDESWWWKSNTDKSIITGKNEIYKLKSFMKWSIVLNMLSVYKPKTIGSLHHHDQMNGDSGDTREKFAIKVVKNCDIIKRI